jgi:hypothetical protein
MPGGCEAVIAINGGKTARLHYLICVWCYRYTEQLQTLRKIASSLPEHVDDCRPETLPHSLKGRLKQALRERKPD